MKPVAGKLFYPNFKFTIYNCMQVKRHALEEWVLCCMLHPSLFLAFLKKKKNLFGNEYSVNFQY